MRITNAGRVTVNALGFKENAMLTLYFVAIWRMPDVANPELLKFSVGPNQLFPSPVTLAEWSMYPRSFNGLRGDTMHIEEVSGALYEAIQGEWVRPTAMENKNAS